MAKVIEQGYYRYLHKTCKSTIEFELKELKETHTTDYLGDRDYYRALTCPACGETILFPLHGCPC